MDTKKFLELVVPDGTMCIADHVTFGDGKKVFIHYPFTDKDKAAKFALAMDSRGSTIYYALATFKETFTNEKGKLRVKRTQKNVDRLKAIWLDIDFKDCPAPELVPKLGTFLKETGLPKPSLIVNSGGGLHVYWCCHTSMSVEEWVPLAEGLKKLCKQHDLPADHVCTSDAARVLRPVGTHNRKHGEKEVRLLSGTSDSYDYETLLAVMPKVITDELPAHLRRATVDTSEYADTGSVKREVSTKQVVRNCAVLRHVLKTGGSEQSEPEWNATLLLLRFLPDGAKLVHPMSKGHIDYSASATMQKWQEKLEADVSGPPLCSTLEQYGHTERCQTCPIYQSKRAKTPLSLGYADGAETPTPKTQKIVRGNFVSTPTHNFPNGWRDIPGNQGIERKVFNKTEGEWEWEKVLKRTWRLRQAQKSTNSDEYTYVVEAKTTTGKPISIEISGADLWGSTRTWETLSLRGAPLTTAEQTHWKDLMATWLQKLQEECAVLDTTEQLGWIDRIEDGERKLIGFASGGAAFFKDGTTKESVVTANHKHKAIANYYTPVGKDIVWRDVFEFYRNQNLPHVMTMMASAFAGPLVKFTGQSGAILAIVSTGTSAGKSLSLEAAQAVWGDPKLGSITLNDTQTVVKNKLAYLQNLPAYWDEVRGNERTLHDFVQTAFQITQGKDRERADRSARTIAAQTWHTMLVCTSNESVFDLAADETGASDAGVYRIFEVAVLPDEKPSRDPRIASMVAELQNHYGRIGEEYGKYLARNVDHVKERVDTWRTKIEEHFESEPAERFWVATVAALLAGMETANKANLANFDVTHMAKYLFGKYKQLRVRVTKSRMSTDPKELLLAYMMQHMHERLVVDKLIVARGGVYQPTIIGNPANIRKLTYQIGKDQGILRVSKQDFTRWMWATRKLRLSGDLEARFRSDCNMIERPKASLGAGTQFAMPRGACLDFDIDTEEVELGE